jgi:adenylosuccinate synthase
MCGKELTWEEVTRRSGYGEELVERTTVTKRVRRVCEFDMGLVKEATMVNRPTQIALTFVDYIDFKNYGVKRWKRLTTSARKFVDAIEKETGVPVTIIKTGPDITHTIDLRKNKAAFPSSMFDEGLHV